MPGKYYLLMFNHIPQPGERVEKASRFVPKCNRLLDVGCGDGIIAYFLKEKVKQIYGVDNLSKDLQKAKKQGLQTRLVNIDKEKLPYANNYFDAITSLDVVEHVLDPRFHLKEMYRVLKKKGVLIISTPNIRFSDHLMQLVFKGAFPKTSLDPDYYDGGHIHFFTYKDMHELLMETGFKKIKNEGIINKEKRGWKGRLIESILGKSFMREFRTPGILLIAEK